jgi:predicted nucleic acid-binding protein
MMVLVDTPVWSIAFRRRSADLNEGQQAVRKVLEGLILEGRVALPGAVRQELLTGVRDEKQLRQLRNSLRAFPDVGLVVEDYEEAARLSNVCRTHGIAGSPIDFLICAVAILRNWSIMTLDQDFVRYARHIPLELFRAFS